MIVRPAILFACFLPLALTGCATLGDGAHTTTTSASLAKMQGSVHGGQQPVSGGSIQLYETSTAGYFAAARPLLAQAVLTGPDGGFNITAAYTCTAGNQIYLTATGGNPGLTAGTNNSALVLAATLGSCSYVLRNRNSIFVNVNEVTTVATAWSLARFASSPTNAGTSSGNATGLANAFANVNNVVTLNTGLAPGPALPAGATLPVTEINTLADILATCVNSDGNLSTNSACSQLFAAATPPGGNAPTDTYTAALNIARNPTNNVTALYNLTLPTSPFQPILKDVPANWMIGIHYTGGGLAQPSSVAIDSNGNVWTANPANNSVSEFTAAGAVVSHTSGFTDTSLSGPSAIAIDANGNAWVTNATAASVTGFKPSGVLFGTLATNLSKPSGIAFDGSGNSWVLSPGTGTLVEFGSTGSFLQQSSVNATPTAIAINPY